MRFFKKLVKSMKSPSLEKLQVLHFVAQQVVLSVESSVKLPGPNKKAVAVELTGKILEEMGVVAPGSLVDTLIESSVHIMNAGSRK